MTAVEPVTGNSTKESEADVAQGVPKTGATASESTPAAEVSPVEPVPPRPLATASPAIEGLPRESRTLAAAEEIQVPAADAQLEPRAPPTASAAAQTAVKPKKAAVAPKTAKGASGEAALKPAAATREDNLVYDLQNMSAYDIAPLNPKTNFLVYTRDSVQLLVNKMFSLERTGSDEGAVVELPEEVVFKLPRQKPIPKVKPKTRWQQFMEDRNMRKRKRSRLVWDEVSGDWKPRWGYKSIKKSQAATEWVHEVREGDDPNQNPFERKSAEKKLLQARQKMREVRNKVEASGGKMAAAVPDLSFGARRGPEGLKEAIKRAQVSSASFGKFDRVAPNEATNLQPKTRKVPMASPQEEKNRYLKAATRCLSSEGQVDKAKAAKVGLREFSENPQAAAARKKAAVKGKGIPGKNRRSKQGQVKRRKGKR